LMPPRASAPTPSSPGVATSHPTVADLDVGESLSRTATTPARALVDPIPRIFLAGRPHRRRTGVRRARAARSCGERADGRPRAAFSRR
jgi:hypothetical protein